MWVVKIGGSLLDYPGLSDWLKLLCNYGAGKVVIVPGGGEFADQVRHQQSSWKFNDKIAHRMALRSMDQYGLMLTGTVKELSETLIPASTPDEILNTLSDSKIPVWMPTQMLDLDASIPQNWDMTSDSLAAWLAGALDADHLILIKMIASTVEYINSLSLEKDNIVDPLFRHYSKKAAFQTHILHADHSSKMKQMLLSENSSNIEKPSGSVIT